MKHKLRNGMDALLLSSGILLMGFSTYNCFGPPRDLHDATERIFCDYVHSYKVKGGTLSVIAEEKGWDGSGWTKKEAIQSGNRHIEKLYSAVQKYNPEIEKIQVTVYYLDEPVLKRTLFMSSDEA